MCSPVRRRMLLMGTVCHRSTPGPWLQVPAGRWMAPVPARRLVLEGWRVPVARWCGSWTARGESLSGDGSLDVGPSDAATDAGARNGGRVNPGLVDETAHYR